MENKNKPHNFILIKCFYPFIHASILIDLKYYFCLYIVFVIALLFVWRFVSRFILVSWFSGYCYSLLFHFILYIYLFIVCLFVCCYFKYGMLSFFFPLFSGCLNITIFLYILYKRRIENM